MTDADEVLVQDLADRLMGAHWSWDGNKPTNFMVPQRETAVALARIAISFMRHERGKTYSA